MPPVEDNHKTKQPPPPSQRVGYVQPSRIGTKGVIAYIDKDLRQEFKRVAQANGTTMQDMIRGFIMDTLAANREPEAAARLRKEIVERQRLLSALLRPAPKNSPEWRD